MSSFSELINRLRPTLNDAAKDRHSDAKLLDYAVDGLRAAVLLRPDLFIANTAMTAQAGVAQDPGGTVLRTVDVYATQSGDTIEFADFATFTSYNPKWRQSVVGPAEIWMRLPGDASKQPQRQFFVWPPQAGTETLLISVVAFNPVLALGDAIPLPQQLEPALEAYVIGRAESEDDQHAVSGRALAFLTQFEKDLGVGAMTQKTTKQ